MAQATIIWTFLPNGVEKGKLRFSVLPSFRLPESAGKNPNLAIFPEVVSWPDTLKGIAFSAALENGPAMPVTRTSPDPDPELWKAVFQPKAPVFPFKFADLSRNAILAFPARHVKTFIAQQYITTAVDSPEEPPSIDHMLRPEALGQIRMKPVAKAGMTPLAVQRTEPVMRQQVQKTVEAQKVKAMPVAMNPDPPQDFYLLRRFHQPRNKMVMDSATKQMVPVRVPLKTPEIDFHQAVALINQYPALMRLLGLAVDFEMAVPANMPRVGSIRVVPGDRKDNTPWTRFAYEAPRQRFAPAAKDAKPEVVDGFLNLADDEEFDIVQFDLDGAALKTAELSDEAEKKNSGELPALRSGGLSVVRNGHAQIIARALVAATENNAALESRRPITFYAEDLVQGYRIDVWDDRSKAWHSLCQRKGTYRFTRLGGREVELEDEGYVTTDVTQAADGSSQDIYAHESMFSWDGWSLVAPRPGKVIDPEDNVKDIQNEAITAFRLETKFKPVPGSLPRLRFGAGYRIRARAVDLAGNSLDAGVADDKTAIPAPPDPPHVYSRFDPVAPPVVILKEAAKRGESLDEVVIRSFNDEEPKDTVATDESAERHLAPPKTAQLTAEIHGQFDIAKGLNPESYALIAAKDGGIFKEVEPGDTLELPYLPDPWAKGITIRGLPHRAQSEPMQIEFSGDWPERKLLRLKVVEGEGAPAWDSGSRVLTVSLKKGEKATLRLSSYLTEDKLQNQGLFRWIEKPQLAIPKRLIGPTRAPLAPGVASRSAVAAAAAGTATGTTAAGTNMAGTGTPSTSTTSATQGGTQGTLSGTTAQSTQGTLSGTTGQSAQAGQNTRTVQGAQAARAAQAKAQVQAPAAGGLIHLPAANMAQFKAAAVQGFHWMMTPYRDVNVVHAVQQPVGRPASKKFEALKGLGDTYATLDAELAVHAWSTAKIDLLADWQEPLDNVLEPAWRTITGSAHVLEVPLARELESLVLSPDKKYHHEFHDTKYRKVTYHAVASSRYREQMPKEIAGDPTKLARTSDPIEVLVPNSARPALPKVLYVVPTFGWERQHDPGRMTTTRTGGGLRVYLERPWFSSGDGEQLAVVLLSPAIPPQETRVAAAPVAAAGVAGKAQPQGQNQPQTQGTAQLQGTTTEKMKMVTPETAAASAAANASAPTQPQAKTQAARMAQPQAKARVAPVAALIPPPVPDALKPFVTQWGIDPLWRSGDTSTPEYPLPTDFKTARTVMQNLTIGEVPGVARFTAVGHDVKFDEERGLWYCDLEIAPKDAYYPFVRLALARFQPNSIIGAHLSRVVIADFIQLVPGRSVSVVPDRPGTAAKSLTVSVSGVSYVQTAAESGPGEIEASFETRSPGIEGELGWAEVAGSTVALRAQRVATLAPGHFTWMGKVNVPARGGKDLRLVIREYEKFVSDEVERPSGPTLTAAAVPKKVRRLVFAEIIEL